MQGNEHMTKPEGITVTLSEEHFAYLMTKMREFKSGCASVGAVDREKAAEIYTVLFAHCTRKIQ